MKSLRSCGGFWRRQRSSTFTVIVLVLVDLLGNLVLLVIEDLAVLLGQLAAVLRAHLALFFIDGAFFLLDMARFAASKLSALFALANPSLLVLLAMTDGWLSIVTVGSGEACSCEHRRECE